MRCAIKLAPSAKTTRGKRSPLAPPRREIWRETNALMNEEKFMTDFNSSKGARVSICAAMAAVVTVGFAAVISTGVVTPSLAPLDPLAAVWDYAPAPAATRPGA